MTFSDFAYVIDTMKLGLDRDTILQMFTYMDSNKDNMLKYPDFCNLCSEFRSPASCTASVFGS